MGTDRTGTAEAPVDPHVDPEQLLFEELSRVRGDRALVLQLARLVQLSRDLRSRRYTGQVTLHLGNALVNSVRQDQSVDWRTRELVGPSAPPLE